MFAEDISEDFSDLTFTGIYSISGYLRNLRGRLLSSEKFSEVLPSGFLPLSRFQKSSLGYLFCHWSFLFFSRREISSELWACQSSLKPSKALWAKFFALYRKSVSGKSACSSLITPPLHFFKKKAHSCQCFLALAAPSKAGKTLKSET